VSRDGDGGDDDENREDAAASTISLAACMSESIAWLAGYPPRSARTRRWLSLSSRTELLPRFSPKDRNSRILS
jgi:hypothetical protein